ncbi:MAG: hypothetical protein ACUVS7_02100 [Bryobacteraceae bacterium]
MRQLLWGFALMGLSTLLAAGGEQSAAPLGVQLKANASSPEPAAILEMENLSGKPVAAYAVRLIRRGEDGKAVSIRTHAVSTSGLGVSLGRPSFRPGEKWSDTVKLAEGERVEAHVDLVLFEDGTHWGPNKSKQLERFQGLRDGARLERQAVKRQE